MNQLAFDLPVLDERAFSDGCTEGVAVLVDKPHGWSSFKVVRVIRSFTGVRKVGHAGTLDPMATGLLICCVGRAATKQIDRFVGLDKIYQGTLRLGETTASYDAESPVDEIKSPDHITVENCEHVFAEFLGDQLQQPPMYSAVKIDGQRLYKLARKGVTIDRPDRPITIHSLNLIDKSGPDVMFEVTCSKGTYIRTLAHDIGQSLGVGAHLVQLRRTAIGTLTVDHALDPRTLQKEGRE